MSKRRSGRTGRVVAATAIVIAAGGAAAAAFGFDLTALGGPAEAESSGAAPATAEVVAQTLTQ
ncbi:hypothetical protein, partial [Glycomyces paridis]